MTFLRRWMWPLVLVLFTPLGCAPTLSPGNLSDPQQVMRVRLVEDADRVEIRVSANPSIAVADDPAVHPLNFTPGVVVSLSRTQTGWQLGSLAIAGGAMTLWPGTEGSVQINGSAYRGFYRFVPTGGLKFDVVNVVNIEGYLKGVVAREMYSDWRMEAYKAQAIVARTYALYLSHTEGLDRYWDVYADQRSQMYGGISGESAKSRQAVDETAGVVVVWGPGEGKIFKAYFSSCCGGVTQSVNDAFPAEPNIEPLMAQNVGPVCSASRFYNWGPITIGTAELSRRFRLWGERKSKEEHRPIPEASMGQIVRIELQAANEFGRPSRFRVVDSLGRQYSLPAEDLRSAADTDAAAGTSLPSGYCQVSVNGPTITFHDGHGFGHGVGMCQFTAEARAAEGWPHEDIIAAAFPHTRLVKAY